MIGLYQILFLHDVADHAAVHETVEAVKHSAAGTRAAGFVNAILRRVLREKPAILAAMQSQPLGIKESHPDALVERWTARYGEPATARLCEWNNTRPQVVVHPNPARTTMTDFLTALRAAGIEATPHPHAPDEFLTIPRGKPVKDIPGYDGGLFSVHDPSTMTAVALLDPQPGDRVLDACAAPGGKTILIAERLRGSGLIVAVDENEERLPRLKENVARLGLGLVQVAQADSATDGLPAAVGSEPFDRILLDVPCSNTGVLRRRPEARWRFSDEDLGTLVATQTAILDRTARLLRIGGTLVYSTCSLEPEENEALLKGWLAEHPAFQLRQSVSLFPGASQTDGAYAAALVSSTSALRGC
jgi:16S rRNA (cytosine967-C5)-methyltransferase